jgi:hypothetical protein
MPIVAEQIELQTNRDSTVLRLVNVEKFADGSGYRCDLTLRSRGFSCEHRFFFDEDSLTVAIASLHSMIKGSPGKAIIKPSYEDEFLCFEMNRLGHVVVNGALYEHGELPQSLKFTFRTDQTVLAPLLAELVILHGA